MAAANSPLTLPPSLLLNLRLHLLAARFEVHGLADLALARFRLAMDREGDWIIFATDFATLVGEVFGPPGSGRNNNSSATRRREDDPGQGSIYDLDDNEPGELLSPGDESSDSSIDDAINPSAKHIITNLVARAYGAGGQDARRQLRPVLRAWSELTIRVLNFMVQRGRRIRFVSG
jgi:hypothetical protein